VRTTHIAAPVERVFAFFAQPQNLALLTPPRLRFRVVQGPDRPLREGDRIVYAMRMHGIPVRWSSRIVSWRENESFADLQERGPFQRWLHTHRFASTPEGTEMRDEVEYELPLGIAGRIAAGWFVRRELESVFDYRGQSLAQRLVELPGARH